MDENERLKQTVKDEEWRREEVENLLEEKATEYNDLQKKLT